MKLSAFLAVSLPLVAMSVAPAFANDAMAETGSWLQASLASMKAPAKQTTRKVSHAMPVASAPAVKMRAFVPNRYLPHESDLRRALVAQQAQVDNSLYLDNSRALSGEVNANYAAPRAVSQYGGYQSVADMASQMPMVQRAKAAAKKAMARAPRVMPGQTPFIPEQLAPAQAMQPFIPEPPVQRSANRPQFPVSMPVAIMPQAPTQNSRNGYMQPLAPSSFEPPQLSQQDVVALERLVAQNRPTAVMDFNGDIYGTAQDNPANGTGPAPFPMNLMPGNAMQSLHKSHRQAHVPQARFGSWHGDGALPDSGFHSYVHHRSPQLFSYTVAPMRQAAPLRKTATAARRPTKPALSAAVAPNPPAMMQASKPKPVVVASYPVVTSARGFAY